MAMLRYLPFTDCFLCYQFLRYDEPTLFQFNADMTEVAKIDGEKNWFITQSKLICNKILTFHPNETAYPKIIIGKVLYYVAAIFSLISKISRYISKPSSYVLSFTHIKLNFMLQHLEENITVNTSQGEVHVELTRKDKFTQNTSDIQAASFQFHQTMCFESES